MNKRDAIPAVIFIGLMVAWFMWSMKHQKDQVAQRQGSGSDTEAVSFDSMTPASSDTGIVRTPLLVDGTDTEVAAVPVVPPVMDETGLLPAYRGLSAAPTVELNNHDLSTWIVDVEAGGIRQVTLHDYLNDQETGKLELGHESLPMLGIFQAGTDLKLSHGRVVPNGGDPTQITVGHQILGTQVEVLQTWTLEEHSYELQYAVTLVNHGDTPVVYKDLRLNAGTMRPTDAPRGFMGAGGMDQVLDVLPTEKTSPKMLQINKLAKWTSKGENDYANESINWASTQNKYFAVIVDGADESEPFTGVSWHTPLYLETTEDDEDMLLTADLGLPTFDIPAGGSATQNFEVYVGPKKWEIFKDMGHGKKKIMNFDLFWFWHFAPMEAISKALFWLIISLGATFNNFGWAIVVTTILLSILFAWPRHKSSVLSRRMAKLQPEMVKLKEKYADDPQKLQMKTMELYKIHKVNPATGCLPVVFQIPVFFAFYNVLRSAVELRQVDWLWVHDLSMPDAPFELFGLPINILAIAMGLSMVLNQKLMPTTADPNQQRMMLFMSVFFVFIGYSMPAGLTLYWATNSICSLVQYQISRRLLDREVGDTDPAPAKDTASSKKQSKSKDAT